MLQDALRKALTGDTPLEARVQTQDDPQVGGVSLPRPEDSDWGRLMASTVPAGASIGRWDNDTSRRIKELKARGRRRDARALAEARTQFFKKRDKAAWRAAKARWTELGWSEKLYRRIKSEGFDAAKVVERLHSRRSESMGARSGLAAVVPCSRLGHRSVGRCTVAISAACWQSRHDRTVDGMLVANDA